MNMYGIEKIAFSYLDSKKKQEMNENDHLKNVVHFTT